MENKINCKVEECIYNKANQCAAENVEVCSCGCSHVTCPDETACKTFRKCNKA